MKSVVVDVDMSTDDKTQNNKDNLHPSELRRVPIPDDEDWPQGLPSLQALSDAEYLIARGVRPMALVGDVVKEDRQKALMIMKMVTNTGGIATMIPFLVKRDDDWYACGFTKHEWAIDLLRWLESEDIPTDQRNRILGMLLGYSPEAIAHFDKSTSMIVE